MHFVPNVAIFNVKPMISSYFRHIERSVRIVSGSLFLLRWYFSVILVCEVMFYLYVKGCSKILAWMIWYDYFVQKQLKKWKFKCIINQEHSKINGRIIVKSISITDTGQLVDFKRIRNIPARNVYQRRILLT